MIPSFYIVFTFPFFSCVVSIYQAVTLPKKEKVWVVIHFCTPTKHFNFKFPLPFKVKLTKKNLFSSQSFHNKPKALKQSLSESLSVAGFTYNANTLFYSFRLTKDRCEEEEKFQPLFPFLPLWAALTCPHDQTCHLLYCHSNNTQRGPHTASCHTFTVHLIKQSAQHFILWPKAIMKSRFKQLSQTSNTTLQY